MRGVFGEPPLDARTVETLGFELALLLGEARADPRVLIAGDTRDSTPALISWLAAGVARGGGRMRSAGTLPTPAVAELVRELDAAAGIAVSASHNRWPDNGIKLVGADGFKWTVAREAELERRLRASLESSAPRLGEAATTATAEEPALRERYQRSLRARMPAGEPLAGMRLVLDAANGAASSLAGEIFTDLGADAEVIHGTPDGRNINRACGSTHPESLAERVVSVGADLGFAFDGDADRTMLVDAQGRVHDGDAMLFLWARHLAQRGELGPAAIVATSMSNLGLERALAPHGIAVVRCDVGDRAVVETLRGAGLRLGGEQSGHLVCLSASTTGDGLLTALTMARLVAEGGQSVSDLLAGFRRYPQLLRNLRVTRKQPFDSLPKVVEARRSVESRLGTEGRLVLRYSGTEPLARIMSEGPDQATIEGLAGELEAALVAELGH